MRIRAIIAALLLFASPAYAQKSKSVLQSEVTSSFPDQTTGALTPAIVRGVFSDFINSWQQYQGVNQQVGTTYTIQLSDYGQLVTFNNSGAIAVTLPQAAGSFSTFNFIAKNIGTGTTTITPQGGSTINGASSISLATNDVLHVVSDGTNYQISNINLASPPCIGCDIANQIYATTLGITVTNPALSVPVTTFLNGGDSPVNNNVAQSIYVTTTGPSSSQLGPALIVQQIANPSGDGALGAIVGGFQNISATHSITGYGLLGIINNSETAGTPSGVGLWGLIRGTKAGSLGIGDIDGLRATSEVGSSVTPSATITIDIATPTVIHFSGSHGYVAGDQIWFATTGALPTGLAINTVYFVISAGLTSTQLEFSATPGGSAVNTSGSQSGTQTASSPQMARGGLFVTNNQSTNPFIQGVYVESAWLYGFRVGSGANTAAVYEPTYPYAYVRKDGSQPFQVDQTGVITSLTGFSLHALAFSGTAPTVASGFCSTGSPVTALSANNGTAAFDILIGAATCGSTGTLTMPAATTGWVCNATDVTTPASHNIVQTGTQGSTTAVVLTDYSRTLGTAQNFNPADHIHVQCTGF